MPAFIATIELKDITASEFEHIDSALLDASFICIKKDSTDNQQKDIRSGAYIKRGTNITINDVSSQLLNTLYKKGRKYSFTLIKEKLITY